MKRKIMPVLLALASSPLAGDRTLDRMITELYRDTVELNAPVEGKLDDAERARLQELLQEQVPRPAILNPGPVKFQIDAVGYDEEAGATYELSLTADPNRKRLDIREREPRWQPVILDIYLPGNSPNEEHTNYDVRIIDYEPRGLDFTERAVAGSIVSDIVWLRDGDRLYNARQPPRHGSTVSFITANYRKGVEEVLEDVRAALAERRQFIAENIDRVRNEVTVEREQSAEEELGSIRDSFPYDVRH